MVFIVTALMIEAAPIIEYYSLKKDMSVKAFQVYKNSDMVLIISGVGKIKSAMAVVHLLSIYNKGSKMDGSDVYSNDILVNIGLCGAGDSNYDIGRLLIINKVTDMDTGRDYYPDVFCGKNLPSVSLCCYSRPIKSKDMKVFCDMESAGIMEATKKFFYAHQVLILKVISDYLAPEKLDKKFLKSLIENNITLIDNTLREVKYLNEKFKKFSLNEEESKFVEKIVKNLKFTDMMKQIIVKDIVNAKKKGTDVLNVLGFSLESKVNSKLEGKKIFEHIRQKLK
ncbi:UNVERIFIED_CONTAM: nucleoside phosphorylase [Acetivibrio alkalicellulosi]